MSERPRAAEPVAGGPLGKLAGRAKEVVGSVLGRPDLHREGRLQQVQVEAEEQAAAHAEAAREKEEEAGLLAERAEAEAERRELELEASEMRVEDEIESGAAELKRQARRAEEAADAVDPEKES